MGISIITFLPVPKNFDPSFWRWALLSIQAINLKRPKSSRKWSWFFSKYFNRINFASVTNIFYFLMFNRAFFLSNLLSNNYLYTLWLLRITFLTLWRLDRPRTELLAFQLLFYRENPCLKAEVKKCEGKYTNSLEQFFASEFLV